MLDTHNLKVTCSNIHVYLSHLYNELYNKRRACRDTTKDYDLQELDYGLQEWEEKFYKLEKKLKKLLDEGDKITS